MTMRTEPFIVNIGPQHPSTHGVFRMRVVLDGETIVDADMVVGYLHRSLEKLAEERTYTQNIPFTDRMDYLSAMSNNLGYCLAVEKLAGIRVPERAHYLRVIMAELQRIANHSMAIGTFINDCGAWQTPLLWMFAEREKILDLFEMTCGARLTCNYMRIGGVAFDIPPEFLPALNGLLADLPHKIDEYEAMLLENEILIARARGVGVIPKDLAISASLSGPMIRASGVPYDVRKADPYAVYDRFEFAIPFGENGDSYDRFLVRMAEMRQSVKIVQQAVRDLPGGPYKVDVPLSIRPPIGDAYARVESPKGELGYYVVSDGGTAPYRFHVRPPSYINLSVLREMVVGSTVADSIVALGSIDIVIGEVDR
ncbi:MAG TPA: NADH-quinone oxidoreductase subunit D [Dehalococcoidia bacterium]|nr:NADH-quinone oxidoreductase subunit D [Dehalococcoidia bacterium]